MTSLAETQKNLGIKEHPFKNVLTTHFKVRLIKDLIKNHLGGRLLDVCCGSGFLLSQFENHFSKNDGIDMSPEAIEFGKQFTHAQLIVGNAEEMPYEDNSFDCIIATDAFEHIPDDYKAIQEVKRTLKPNGVAVIYVPSNVGILSNTKLVDLYHTSEKSYLLDQRYYTVESLTKLVESAGLKVEKIFYHNFFFQEFFTQMLKFAAHLMGKEYEHQADIASFKKGLPYTIYKWILFPLFWLIIRTEEVIFEKIFMGKVKGHRITVKCSKSS